MNTAPKRTEQVFLSYSHREVHWKERVAAALSCHTTHGPIRVWADDAIDAGRAWRAEIADAIGKADLALLLVSENYLKSEYVRKFELPAIQRRAESDRLPVAWIPIDDAAVMPNDLNLSEIQAACDSNVPLSRIEQVGGDLEPVFDLVRRRVRSCLDPDGEQLRVALGERYQLERYVAQGPMLRVYKAYDPNLGRDVAIKVLKNEEDATEFRRSLQAAGTVDAHAGIITLFAADLQATPAYCVTQYVEGKTLRARLAQNGASTLKETSRVLLRLASALRHAHERHIYHLNLRPTNIVIEEATGRPFISAFSHAERFCRNRDLAAVGALDFDSEAVAFAIPEQHLPHLSSANPDRADQYLLGLVAYEMLAGEVPETVVAQRGKGAGPIEFRRPVPLEEICPGCPTVLGSVVEKMTALDPEDRFPSIAAAVEIAQKAIVSRKENLAVARKSYRRCLADRKGVPSFFEAFYARFLESCPEARRMFVRFGSVKWGRQHLKLQEALLLLFVFCEQEDHEEPTVLTRLAMRHGDVDRDGLGVAPRLYEHFLDAMLHVVAEYDPECGRDALRRSVIEDAWRAALGPGIQYMQARFKG